MRKFSCIFFLLIGLCPLTSLTQQLIFTELSSETGLPSHECYKILQDKQGYIWFSTDNGLCRYSNGKLKIFDEKNGLPEESVYNITEDQSGTLWFATSDNRILYYDKGKLAEASFSKEYSKPGQGEWAHPIPMMLDMSKPGYAYIANSYYAAEINIKANRLNLIPRTNPEASMTFLKFAGHSFIPQNLINTKSRIVQIVLKNNYKSEVISFPDMNVKNPIHWNTPTAFVGNTDFIGISNKLLKVNSDLSHSEIELPGRIISIYTDRSNGLWVGVEKNGVFYYPDITTMKLGHRSLAGFSVTGICEDNERGIWCTTLEKGVFYSRNKNLISYAGLSQLDKNLTLLEFFNGNLFASSSTSLIYTWRNGELNSYNFEFNKSGYYDILKEDNGWLLAGKEIIVRTSFDFSKVQEVLQKPYHGVAGNELAKVGKRTFAILGKNLREVNETNFTTLHTYFTGFTVVTMIAGDGNNLLLGGNQGLYEFDIITGKSRKIQGIPKSIKRIIRTRSGRVWIATKNDGIFWLDGRKVTNAGSQLKLKTNLFYDLTEDEQGNVYAASNLGLYSFIAGNTGYQTMVYGISHGLLSNEVFKVAADNDHLWFSTFEGLFSLPLKVSSFNNVSPAIHFNRLLINGKSEKADRNTFETSYNRNDLSLLFDILTFKNGSETKLEYQLESKNELITARLTGNQVLLQNLAPGSYKLSVYAINNDGVRSAAPEVFQFKIEPPFWLTWWFIVLAIVVGATILVFVIRVIVLGVRKSEEAKTLVNKLLAEYQITALQAQMNPHFIFNAINTIQGYILEKNEEEAYDYLAKFGQLIRMVLHHSQEKSLLLEDELEVLNLYIELEQLRFDNCFDFELKVSDEVDQSAVYLPGMLLQPYVENAIWHGIVNLEGEKRGKLKIEIWKEEGILVVSVTDNGIGRERAMSFRKDQRHKSVGMQLTGQRLKVMNQLHGYETASVEVTDLFEENQEPAGTEVKIRIPVNIEV